jgi:hypothetical protein
MYGRLLKLLGFLSNGDVVLKTASDFMGQYVGESAKKTSAIIEAAKGKLESLTSISKLVNHHIRQSACN